MPKVFNAIAAKDYPEKDIKKGDRYYYWAFFRGPKMMSKTPPRRSQTTGSSKLSNVYAAEEALQDALSSATTVDDIVNALQEAYDAAEECISEYEESISNLEEGFPNGCPALEETQEARDNIEAWKDELDNAKSDVEALSADDYKDEGIVTPEGEEEREVKEFDDLDENEKESMLSDAQDLANAVSLEL